MKNEMTEQRQIFESLGEKIEILIGKDIARDELLMEICRLLEDGVDYYDWVGFYMVDPHHEKELVLGPYVGEPTDHVRIPFGQGICGQAAEREETFLIDDVTKESNYLSCSVHVKSEIVVPIFRNETIVGQLDIDSHTPSAFTEADRVFLERLCELIGPVL